MRTGFAALLVALLATVSGARAGDDVEDKLAALEEARRAGILTREEYERKRAALEAKAAVPDEATQRKLDALGEARRAGILSEEEYQRKRAEVLGGAPVAPEAAGLPVHTQRKGRLWRHVAGFSFWYPDDWTVKEHDEFLQLIPADAGATPEGPTELYFVVGESVAGQGLADAADARVVAWMEQQVHSVAPQVRQTGRPGTVAMASGEGAVIRWEGRTPKGDEVEACAYACIRAEHCLALLAICLKERMHARGEDLRRIFVSFGVGEGARDPALVGRWKLVGVASITNWSTWESHHSRAHVTSSSESTLVFHPDGRWERHDTSHMILGAGDVYLEDKSESRAKGRWNAADGSLYMVWEDNSWDDFEYRVLRTETGTELRTLRGKHGEVWERVE